MKKVVFIIVRYSVLVKSKVWNISKDTDFSEYKEKLFEKKRLDQHFYFFYNVMLPSVASQVVNDNDLEVKLLILTSTHLPLDARSDLEKATESYSWADIVFVEPEVGLNKSINNYLEEKLSDEQSVFATVRLDDDDALHAGFLNSLRKYLSTDFSGYIVSYPKGSAVLYDEHQKKTVSAIELYYPKNAQGMSLINSYNNPENEFKNKAMNIFQTGKHTTVDERYPLVLDESIFAYVRMCYKSQDTAESFYKKKKKVSKEVSPQEAFSGFSVNLPLG